MLASRVGPETGRGPWLAGVRSNRLLRTGSPWLASCAVHAALLMTLGVVLWRLGGEPPIAPPPPVVSLTDPSLGRDGLAPAIAPREGASTEGDGGGMRRAAADLAEAGVRTSLLSEIGLPSRLGAAPPPSVRQDHRVSGEPVEMDLGIGAGSRRGGSVGQGEGALAGEPEPREVGEGGANVTFAGLGSSGARSVVYVVDASGPMVGSLREVIAEIERSVARLLPSQKFGVVVFHDPGRGAAEGGADDGGALTGSFMPILIRATPDARARLSTWLASIEPKGRSNPLDGLRAGLSLKPEAVFLLSRSIERTGGGVWHLGLDATMQELDRLNPRDERAGHRSVAIKTIQFLDEDSTGIMQAIGRQHGGADDDSGYRVIRRVTDLE